MFNNIAHLFFLYFNIVLSTLSIKRFSPAPPDINQVWSHLVSYLYNNVCVFFPLTGVFYHRMSKKNMIQKCCCRCDMHFKFCCLRKNCSVFEFYFLSNSTKVDQTVWILGNSDNEFPSACPVRVDFFPSISSVQFSNVKKIYREKCQRRANIRKMKVQPFLRKVSNVEQWCAVSMYFFVQFKITMTTMFKLLLFFHYMNSGKKFARLLSDFPRDVIIIRRYFCHIYNFCW